MTSDNQLPRLLVVQPSDDYAHRVRRVFDDAVFLATRDRARQLTDHPHVIAADLSSPGKAHRAVQRYLRRHTIRLSGITCFVCDHLALTAALAHLLDLPFHSEEAVRRSRRKDLAFIAWASKGLATPATCVVSSPTQLRVFADRVAGPWILKPKQGTGSAWVLKAGNRAELEAAHWELMDGIASQRRGETSYLAQEMVRGIEISADVYLDGATSRLLRLTEKCLARNADTAGVVQAYFPSRRDAATRSRLAELCRLGAEALGVTRGIVMADVMLASSGPYLLEMSLRPGGDCLPDLCRAATGYDPIESACRVAVGEAPPAVSLDDPRPVAGLHLLADHGGRIESIDFSGLAEDPRVLSYEPYREAGDTLRVWKGSYDDRILAACVAHCADPEMLPALGDALTRRIRVTVSHDSPDNGDSGLYAEAIAG